MESQHTEWKQTWKDDYLKWISAFANADGGSLVIGRDDDGVALGLTDARKLLEELPNKIRDLLGMVVEVNLNKIENKQLIEIPVEAYPYPISYKGRYFLRSGSTTQELRGAALDKFLLKRQGKHWDSVPIPGVSSADLSPHALQRFRDLAKRSLRLDASSLEVPDHDLIDKLHLYDAQLLKRAAILLFHPQPERYVANAFVKIAYFSSNADLVFQDEIRGDLLTQIQTCIDLLQTKYLQAHIAYEGIQRTETLPLPPRALREAVLNAIAHKDYASGAAIQISVYADKLIIWNPGQLPQGWTTQSLLEKHPSRPPNPEVANTLALAGLIESWGRGIEKIIQECTQNSFPLPKFHQEPGAFRIDFPLAQETVRTSGKPSGKPSGKTGGENKADTRGRLIKMIKKTPAITIAQLADSLGLTHQGVAWHINKLKKEGLLTRQGSSRRGSWHFNS